MAYVVSIRVALLIAIVGLAACRKSERATAPPEEKPTGARLVFKDATGRELTMKDLEGVSGKAHWEVVGGDAIPPEASRLHQEARAAGGRGEYARALELLDRAHSLAPAWPYPVYDAAFTYLLQGDS